MKKKIRWMLAALLCAVLLLSGACADGDIDSLAELNEPGRIVGVSQGSAAELTVRNELPLAGRAYFTDNQTAYLAVAQGKIDAFVFDWNQMRIAMEQGVSGVHLLEETMGETVQIGVGISPVSAIPELETKINQFIREQRKNGRLDEMFRRWVMDGEDDMPDIELPGEPKLHLTVGTTGNVMPYSYYKGTELTGYDIELAYRFAAWLGADVEFKVYDFGAIVPAAVTGDVDCIMSNLNMTPERREALPFSEALYEEHLGVMVRGEAPEAPAEAAGEGEAVPEWAGYNGKRLGVLTGPLMEDIAHTYFPDSEYMLFNSYPDCIAALLAGRIDAYLGDELGLITVHAEQPQIDYIRDRITFQEQSFAFRKGDARSAALCRQLNAFLAVSRADGTLQEMLDIWLGVDESRKTVDMSDLTGENGTIRVVTTSTDMPFSYMKDGKNVGYDIDLVVRFCRAAGYQLELGDVDFAARIPAIQSGKYDFTTDMNVTPEREEQVLFSDPTSTGGVVLAVLRDAQAAPATEKPDAPADSFAQMSGKRIGVQVGTTSGEQVQANIPDAKLLYYNNQTDLLTALRAGKIDAWGSDETVPKFLMKENDDLMLLDGYLDTFDLAAMFPKTDMGQTLRDQYSAFVEGLWADGTMAALDDIWFGTDEEKRTVMDYENLPAPNGTLRMALDTSILPFAYVKDNRVVGYDVDLAARFCEAYGYGLKVMPMDFGGVIGALQSGKADLAACGITITEERKESVLFSSPTYHTGAVLTVLKKGDGAAAGQAITSMEQMNGKRIGVQTGTTFDDIVLQSLPEAKISYFNTYPDMAAALEANKIDGFPGDGPVLQMMAAENRRLALLPETLDDFEFAFVLPKTEAGELLKGELDRWLSMMTDSGELETLTQKWTTGPEAEKTVPDYAAFPATRGILHLATEGQYPPMNYYRDGALVGLEIDLAARFCKDYGYGLEVSGMNFDAILPAVQAGKVELGAAGISVTPERMESVLFSNPYYIGGTMMAVLKAEEPAAAGTTAGEEDRAEASESGIVSSFNKTFLRENRWQLFLEGVGNTMLITLLAILFGTLLGFLVFMLCRNGNVVANGVSRFCIWLVQGTPMVVLLMILYYIIFGSVAISGIAVAVIGFTLTFGASVFGLLKMGVGMIDRGQYEAAYALGHSNRRTFFRIILPQAIPHVLPAYQGEIVSLIKATAIVGYIAVQDLTKMGDIVRSRTYEAFFPLIAVTVIYFVLEGLFSFAVSRIRIRIDPKRRRRERILKGVNLHD